MVNKLRGGIQIYLFRSSLRGKRQLPNGTRALPDKTDNSKRATAGHVRGYSAAGAAVRLGSFATESSRAKIQQCPLLFESVHPVVDERGHRIATLRPHLSQVTPTAASPQNVRA